MQTDQSIIIELTGYMETVHEFDKDSGQDGHVLHAYLIQLTNYMARANYLMAEYNRHFRKQKKQAYLNLIASEEASKKYFSASLAKDYVDCQCENMGYIFDLAERCSRLIVHTIDAIRTVISSLKSEREMNRYGGGG